MAKTGKYEFGKIIDRRNTSSLKYDFGPERKGRDDLLPLWVADMDFRIPDEVIDELKGRLDHGIFGYTDPKPDYYEALVGWFQRQHGWEVKPEWNTVTPGVVYALATAVRAFTEKGDGVLIQQPVYYPFSEVIVDNHRRLVNNQLRYQEGTYSIDFVDFEQKIVENKVKLFLLCSPHNPVGRVWSREELTRMGEICRQHQVIIVADEIHGDFVYAGHTHVPFASLSEELANQVVVCTSPSKTFNLAGLQTANIIIPNEILRRQFQHENAAAGYSQGNALGLLACRLVYEKGEDWYRELLDYLAENLAFVRAFLKERIPEIKLVEPEGTYLIWLDCSGLTDSYKELEKLFVEEARLWVDAGKIFGRETALFERINIACSRSTLEQALLQLEGAIQNRRANEQKADG
ncbi:MAG: pyridoxal phosphate-dependent aminotransferase [Lachnospiraceae bacterium]|nr:pyridoxal phosphate-dependent aminotransferase [Lachnospiraceae bacterium]